MARSGRYRRLLIMAAGVMAILAAVPSLGAQSKQKKPQVLLTEGDGWQTDAESQTPETQKQLSAACPEYLFTVKEQGKADYFLLLDHTEGSATVRYKFTLFDKEGVPLATAPPGTLDQAVKGACDSLRQNAQQQH